MADNFTSAEAIQSTGPGAEVIGQTAIPTTTMYVHATSLNIREKASSSSKSIGKLLRGAKVEVVSITKDGWALLAPAVGDAPSATKFVMAKSGKIAYLAKDKPAPLKKTVKPPPPPTASMPDEPPPAPQDTEPSSNTTTLVLGAIGLAAAAYLWWKD